MAQERPDEEKPETYDVRVQDRIQGGATPVQSPTRIGPTRFSEVAGDKLLNTGSDFIGSIWSWINGDPNRNPVKRGKRKRIRTAKTAVGVIALVGFFIFVNWFMLSQLHEGRAWLRRGFSKNRNLKPNPKLHPDLSPSPKRVSVKVSASVQKHLFKWVEDSMYEEINDALPKISSIEIEIEKAKSEICIEIEALKCRIHDLEEESLVTKRDLNKWRVMIKCCCVGFICVTIIAILMTIVAKAKKHKIELGSM